MRDIVRPMCGTGSDSLSRHVCDTLVAHQSYARTVWSVTDSWCPGVIAARRYLEKRGLR